MVRDAKPFVHPYIPNSAPEVRAAMLREIGVASVDELYAAIPEELRLRRRLNLPEPLRSELTLRRHVESILAKNRTTNDCLSFLGGGCWQHDVPAVCEDISRRAEFLTAYGGDSYADLGKYQALFEFQSMVGELVGMEVVSAPTYDWAAAASSALLLATWITGRPELLVPRTIAPERLAHPRNFASAAATITLVEIDAATGLLDPGDLRLGLPKTLLGVDVYERDRLIAADVGERDLLRLVEDRPARIVVTPIGGQGYLFGRGNQQISPAVIRRVGQANLLVVATPSKLAALHGAPFLVDTGDGAVDAGLAGYLRVVTGYRAEVVYRVVG